MKGSGNSRASGIQFYSRIASLLENAAVRFTMTDCGLYCCVRAFMDSGYGHQDNGCGHEIRIVLIPLVARTPAEAVLQREEASSLAGQSYTVIVSEDRWMKSPEIISSRILAHLGIFRGIFARDCEIRKITRPEADSFLARSHSYGGASSRYCYGVFLKRDRIRLHNAAYRPGCSHTPGFTAGTGIPCSSPLPPIRPGAMIAAAEFSNARRWIKDGITVRSYEWIRYASLPDVRINGGMGKVLNHFIREVRPDDIMSYADLEWSDGDVYRALGFEEDGAKGPVMFAVDTRTWTRTPVRMAAGDTATADPSAIHGQPAAGTTMYLQNFGSRKFRLRLYRNP